ncbi:MAG: hypothetical protein WEB04_12300 [Dehalococcoidia bacterium]
MIRLVLGLTTIVAVMALAFGASHDRNIAQANPVGTTAAPLLSCADVDGDGTVGLFGDIFGVAFLFGADADDSSATGNPEPDGYHLLYDVGDGNGAIDLFSDIFGVAFDFGNTCPLVDQQIAQATLAILNDPQAAQLLACDNATLNARGYIRGSEDVPGQGVHYINVSYWDGVFNVTQPEGLVCQAGKLAAELYVVNGDVIGWGPFIPSNGAIHSVNIDTFCDPPAGQSVCSWDGPETWHAHANLCHLHLGTPSSSVIITPSAAVCEAANGGVGNWSWNDAIGWMGHLWNHVPNENQISDVNGTMNGRFADCRPPFKAESCPM